MKRLIPLVALAGVVLSAALAAAQPPAGAPPVARPATAPSTSTSTSAQPQRDERKTEARRHFEQGVALHGDGNFSAALAEFRAAQELWSQAGAEVDALTALYNIGGLERELHRYTDAIATLRQFVERSETVPQATRTQRVELRKMRGLAQALVVEMTALLAPITVELAPRTAALSVDGRPTAVAPDRPIDLAAGAHVLEATADGYHPERRELLVVAGRPQRVELRLRPIAVVRNGRVSITSTPPGARISIDGKDYGPAPVSAELVAGGHRLEATAPGRLPHRSELALGPGQEREIGVVLDLATEPVAAAAERQPIYKAWWFWGAVGAVAAGGVASALLIRPERQPPLGGTYDPSYTDVDR